MKVAVYSTKAYDRHYLDSANVKAAHALRFLDMRREFGLGDEPRRPGSAKRPLRRPLAPQTAKSQ